MDGLRISIEGVAELQKKLKILESPAKRASICERALLQACKPIKAAAKALAPKDTGALRISIDSKVKKYSNGNAVGLVGAKSSFGRMAKIKARGGRDRWGRTASFTRMVFKKPSRYLHLIENGVASLGIPPRPFMRRAKMQTEGQVNRILETEIDAGILKTFGA